jgi:hypothetical protein
MASLNQPLGEKEKRTMFDSFSRYVKLPTLAVADHRGRAVTVVPVPQAPNQNILGFHRRREGERLDHLAKKYLDDPVGFWKIAEANDVMLPESLSEAAEIAIPGKVR